MSSHILISCIALSLAFTTPSLAHAQISDAPSGDDRLVGHRLLIGGGLTLSDPTNTSTTTRPGVMVNGHLALGRTFALGLHVDYTFEGRTRFGRRGDRLLVGPDLKLMLGQRGAIRPWVLGSAVASIHGEAGVGLGAGAGAFVFTGGRTAFFADLRQYFVTDLDAPGSNETLLRAGVAF